MPGVKKGTRPKTMRTKLRWTVPVCLLGSVFSCPAFGCRYTVRDVAFVDIGSNPYHLHGYISDETPEDLASKFMQISYAALIDSNVEFEIINIDKQKDNSAISYLSFWDIESLPAAILVSPEGQSLVLPISLQSESFKESVWSMLESVISSPKREELFQHIVEAYCVVLLIRGEDAGENKRAEGEILGAIDIITKVMDQMPKPIEEPPRLIVIPPESFSQERILLWSLGVDEREVNDPRVAILYGRGRRIGPLLEGEGITKDGLLRILSLIGLSCECGLDRQWTLGTMIPFRWDGKIQSEVVELLGFDAESPMVKIEISQILSMGSLLWSGAEGPVGLSEGGLGEYSETTVELEEAPSVTMMSPAQFRDIASPDPVSAKDGSIFRAPLFIVGVMALLILVGGTLILLRSRWRSS